MQIMSQELKESEVSEKNEFLYHKISSVLFQNNIHDRSQRENFQTLFRRKTTAQKVKKRTKRQLYPSDSKDTLQQKNYRPQLHSKNQNIMRFIVNSLEHPDLSKRDVAKIFELPLETIIQISNNQTGGLEGKERNPLFYHKSNLFQEGLFIKKPLSEKTSLAMSQKELNAKQLILQPPPKIKPVVKAVIEIVKQNPKIKQKDIPNILKEKYGFDAVSQISVSRYIRRAKQVQHQIQILKRGKLNAQIEFNFDSCEELRKNGKEFEHNGQN